MMWRTFSMMEPWRSFISACAFQYRNIILQLQPAQIRGAGFDGERRGVIVLDANTDRCLPVAGQIGLSKGGATGGELFPLVAAHEEFSLNLETHSPPSTGL